MRVEAISGQRNKTSNVVVRMTNTVSCGVTQGSITGAILYYTTCSFHSQQKKNIVCFAAFLDGSNIAWPRKMFKRKVGRNVAFSFFTRCVTTESKSPLSKLLLENCKICVCRATKIPSYYNPPVKRATENSCTII